MMITRAVSAEAFNDAELVGESLAGNRDAFAQIYVLLGEQYQKAGQSDNAIKTWQHGAAIFPGDQALKKIISNSTAR